MSVHAVHILIRGVVQGVGFRPFVYRLAHEGDVRGWVLNGEQGVEIHAEAGEYALDRFIQRLRDEAPPAASIAELVTTPANPQDHEEFEIVASSRAAAPTVRMSPDLCVCSDCLAEMGDPTDRRCAYSYINCTNCGPRFSIIRRLPYDRPHTTMAAWPLCEQCAAEYGEPLDRRFHAQPVACPACGPHYYLEREGGVIGDETGAIAATIELLQQGAICAIKGIGGYHLACDAKNPAAVRALRERKYRKEKPFALLVPDLDTARELVRLDDAAERLLTDIARPIVLAPARVALPEVAPDSDTLGLMLPYAPVHHLLFAAGAPRILVMTSANRSNEPLAYRDEEARAQLAGIADAFLIGQREIARRVDDSITRVGPLGPVILRRARGYAPAVVARIPTERPILAVGPDLKSSITLVVRGDALVSQHIGDLDYAEALAAFEETARDLLQMYDLTFADVLVACDDHPAYASTRFARSLPTERVSVQHHRAHIASALAEHDLWDEPVVGLAFDGTGYGDDGTIWGGECFVGSLRGGLKRAGHLRPALLPGGDAAARFPPQALAGFVSGLAELPDLTRQPFAMPQRYADALALARAGRRTFQTTSMGRLFDAVAALCGYTREISFEGQAAIWLEQLALAGGEGLTLPMPGLDYEPLLMAVIAARQAGAAPADIARAFHVAVTRESIETAVRHAEMVGTRTVVLSGGVFQNVLLLELMQREVAGRAPDVRLLTNQRVPPNDGGVSLGQAALAAAGQADA